jgi:ATP-dependent helicase/nuclease subunit B
LSSAYLDRIAHNILSRLEQDLPDLRGATVLLPSHHVAKPLAQALSAASGRPSLLLPRMVTLEEWALSIPLDAPVATASQRQALLYQNLRKNTWFELSDLWGVTHELLTLFDELTCSLHEFPADAEAFASAVERAYEARQNTALQLEARIVFELWHAMQDKEQLDAARAYQQRLAELALRAERPLFVLRTSDWGALEQRFLDDYARHAEVTVFDLRETDVPKLREIGSIASRLRFYAATSLEQEARAGAMQIRLWLNEGRRNIAIVAQDRVVARRLRALLERADVLVADEGGWTFSTLSVSTALDRWLTALQSNFYHNDLLDLLKSPFVFAELAPGNRKAVVYQLERLLRKHGIVAGLEEYIALVAPGTALHDQLLRLAKAASLLEQDKRLTISEWIIALNGSLRVLGMEKGLGEDDAGARLLQTLAALQKELAADKGRYRFAEWRGWLAQQLDMHNYLDRGIESPVRLTHLAATRWREFDAVLLLGCDTDHLPSLPDGGRWFNDSVRGSLDLPTLATHAGRQRDDLLGLLAINDRILVTWQRERNGERSLLSPYLQVLCDYHKMVPEEDLKEDRLDAYLQAEEAQRADLRQPLCPSPSVAADAVPQGVSVSAYNSLVACPYQFYARHVLQLNELDEVQETIEKHDYGERVHLILKRFHMRYPRTREHAVAELEAGLRQISHDTFAELLDKDFAAAAWLARWYKSVPAYLEWQASREDEGWKFVEAESAFDLALGGTRLRGRIDRLDERGEARQVLDYKTQDDQLLRHKLKEPGEDVQLACYAYAHGADAAAFVSIDNGKVRAIAPDCDLRELSRLNAERLAQLIERMREGVALPANGIQQACGYCEMRGVCRKGEW